MPEFIKINPVEELLKAIGIVNGGKAEAFWRRVVDALTEREGADTERDGRIAVLEEELRNAERATVNAWKGGASMEPVVRELAALREGLERLIATDTYFWRSEIQSLLDGLKPRATIELTIRSQTPNDSVALGDGSLGATEVTVEQLINDPLYRTITGEDLVRDGTAKAVLGVPLASRLEASLRELGKDHPPAGWQENVRDAGRRAQRDAARGIDADEPDSAIGLAFAALRERHADKMRDAIRDVLAEHARAARMPSPGDTVVNDVLEAVLRHVAK